MNHQLRLVPVDGDTVPDQADQDDRHDSDGPLRFDRRTMDRWPMRSNATAFHLGGERFGRMHELKVIDFSHGGLGAICHTPIEPGATVSIGFAAPGHPARRGVVARCTPCGNGYRLAVQFEQRLAA